jgi:hypothetical protein
MYYTTSLLPTCYGTVLDHQFLLEQEDEPSSVP